MTQQTRYPDGAPCWADLNTPDLEGAKRFYGALLGWDFDPAQPEMGYYTMARVGGRTVAAIAPKMPGQEDMPSVWSVYLMTHDADATARAITDNGGNLIVPPMEIPGQGRMLFAIDAAGAAFGAWEPQAHTGAELYDEVGSMCWHEVNAREGSRTDAFYRALFPYEQQQVGDGEKFDYTTWNLDGQTWCGRLQMTAEWEGIPPHWMTYFSVEDTDAAAAKIKELGGKVMQGPFDSPYGRIAVVTDPYGAPFSIIQRQDPTPAS